ncbi:Aminodeoxychorismate lyase [Vibrio aerogenes CECT 7868]|uniref:Aminodeoxychorismate lyase n=1 Tax=Vibrio aerogenes CECT 7868 TaxID=1216006 RepID=A0A1M6D971_9VIBR|nr:aminodeoxychorismate lyase [Vibrio aerogenes]SHI69775.1 Aminodeoxychorismate lyase [Vibrio aerogenes CECT 7868]
MILIDGKSADVVPADDRSYQYGDGCFSTILTLNGQVQYWDYHRQRLESCLKVLCIPYPDWDEVLAWMSRVIKPEAKAGIKIHISRGSGGRGYAFPEKTSPRVMISSFAYPGYYSDLITDGIELGLCRQRLGLNPMLAGHKHNNRLEQILLKNEVTQLGYIDGVVLDIYDNVIETTMANIFWVKNDRFFTPALDQAGVAGVVRRVVTEWVQEEGKSLSVGSFSVDALLAADEVFITNSVLGVAPVIRMMASEFSVGEYTKEIQKRVNLC